MVRRARPDHSGVAGTGRPGDRRPPGPHLRADRDDRPDPADASRAGRARRRDPSGVVRVAQPGRRVRPGPEPTQLAGAVAAPAAAPASDGDATVTFARSKKVCTASAGQTVLEAAEALGVAINYDCRAGICGQCKTNCSPATSSWTRRTPSTPVDRANNVILSCQARCVDQVVVEA